jgi:hypothetical protein
VLRDAFFFLFGASVGLTIGAVAMVVAVNASLRRDPTFWIRAATVWRQRQIADQSP